jgi:plastocyanin
MKRIVLIVLLACIAQAAFAQITGKVSCVKPQYIENTVIFIEKVAEGFTVPKENAQMNQKGLVFYPSVLPILAGTTVEFLNSDDVLHNVFCPDKCSKFDLGSWKKGEKRSYTFKEIGCESVILCNVHPEMEAYIVALQNPYFDIVGADGVFSINGVSPGTYTLKVWNKKLRSKPVNITVDGGGRAIANFELKK